MKTSPDISPVLEQLLLRQCGVEQAFKCSRCLRPVAAAVKMLADRYAADESEKLSALFTDQHLLQAYLLYYLPVNMVKLYPVLDELLINNLLSIRTAQNLNVLDLGCGPGTYLLGFLEYVRKNLGLFPSLSRITCLGVDRSRDCLHAASSLADAYTAAGVFPANIACRGSFRRTSDNLPLALEELASTAERFHIVIAGNVLTELSARDMQPLLRALGACMAEESALVVIDPGTQRSFRNLRMLHDAVLDEPSLHVYAPCLRQEPCPCSPQSGAWCHAVLFWDPPGIVRAIDSLLPFSKQRGIKYSYLICTRQPADRLASYAGLARERIWRVVSYLIRNRGEERMYLCNGAERVLVRRLLKNDSEHNRDFTTVQRGDIVYLDRDVKRGGFRDIIPDTEFRKL